MLIVCSVIFRDMKWVLFAFHSTQTFRFRYYNRLKINNARFMKWNVPFHLKYLWKSLKKENRCLHFTVKFEMQETGYAWGSLMGCKAAPALPSTHLYPPLDLGDLVGVTSLSHFGSFNYRDKTITYSVSHFKPMNCWSLGIFLPDSTFNGNAVFCWSHTLLP